MANATKKPAKKRHNKQPIAHAASWLRFAADLKQRAKWYEGVAGNQGMSDQSITEHKAASMALLQAAQAALTEGRKLRKQR